MNVYLFRYHNNGYFCKSVVLAKDYEQAEETLLEPYIEWGIDIEIEEYEVINERGIALTECIPIK